MNTLSQSLEWLDQEEYPFESKFVQLSTGQMHYVDEGKGDVILFVHGTPSWSFLYRNFIKEFSKTHRCIAIDHIGFGLSEKPDDVSGTPKFHSRNLNEFVEKLELENLIIVLHDFGGPIGLGFANQNPDKIKQVVLFNTWLWETESNTEIQKIDKLISSPLGKFLYLNFNFSPRVLFKKGFYDKSRLTKNIHQQYLKPFQKRSSRHGLYKIAQSLAASSHWYNEQWEDLQFLNSVPLLLIWGIEDKFIGEEHLSKWQSRFSHAEVLRLEAGHFVQEEKPNQSIERMRQFLEESEAEKTFLENNLKDLSNLSNVDLLRDESVKQTTELLQVY